MKYDLICIGTALVDSIVRGFHPEPVSASGFTAESCSLNAGGEAVNVSVAAAKLGLKTAILCALGRDAAGALVRNTLEQYGVDTGLIVDSPQTPVPTMFVNGDGSRTKPTGIISIRKRLPFRKQRLCSWDRFSGRLLMTPGSFTASWRPQSRRDR